MKPKPLPLTLHTGSGGQRPQLPGPPTQALIGSGGQRTQLPGPPTQALIGSGGQRPQLPGPPTQAQVMVDKEDGRMEGDKGGGLAGENQDESALDGAMQLSVQQHTKSKGLKRSSAEVADAKEGGGAAQLDPKPTKRTCKKKILPPKAPEVEDEVEGEEGASEDAAARLSKPLQSSPSVPPLRLSSSNMGRKARISSPPPLAGTAAASSSAATKKKHKGSLPPDMPEFDASGTDPQVCVWKNAFHAVYA
jgi:hypothetical protein